MFINPVKHIIKIKPLPLRVALFFSVMRYTALFLMAVTALFCCTPKKESRDKEEIKEAYKVLELDKRFALADSIVFVFFNDPFTADSIQYTRFYKQYPTTGTAGIKSLLTALDKPFVKHEKPRPCRNEGKAWIFSKNKIFQTVYFGWSKDNCAFIYMIKDGFFYYAGIDSPFITTLINYKAKAIEP